MRSVFVLAANRHEVRRCDPADVREHGEGWELEILGCREVFRIHSQSWLRDPYVVFLPAHLNIMSADKLLHEFMAENPGVLSGRAA